MIPAVFVILDEFPLTQTGRWHDGHYRHQQLALKKLLFAPRTPTEKKLTGIWSALLGVERIGVTDHFMDLGGQSITAMRCLSCVYDTFKIEIPFDILFGDKATVADVAALIDRLCAEHPAVRRPSWQFWRSRH